MESLYSEEDKNISKLIIENFLKPARFVKGFFSWHFFQRESLEVNSKNQGAHYNMGLLYYKEEKYDEATHAHKKALELNPDDESAHYNLAIVYSKKRMYDDAILEYKKVIELNPGLPDVHYNLGVVYSEKGMLMQAKKEVSIYKKLNSRK